MNKFAKLFAGMAVISLAASCSSDEPVAGGNNVPDLTEDSKVYLTVSINDANSFGRAEGEYEDGQGVENTVASARFFFFDDKGLFVTEANVWAGPGNPDASENIELKSNTQLVLQGLKEKKLPKYLLTVINCPLKADFEVNPGQTIESVSTSLFNIKNGSNFIMSTTSFIPETTDKNYDVKYPFVNVLDADKFLVNEPADPATIKKENIVNIYVERLAAKVSLEASSEYMPVEVTVAGFENNEDFDAEGKEVSGDDKGKTKLYVKINGFDVTTTENQSYLSKQILNFATEESVWSGWNYSPYFRSFWGKSVNYGEAAPSLNEIYLKDIANAKLAPVYTYETTNTLANVQNENGHVKESTVPCAIISATIYEKDGNEYKTVDLVLYNGVYYEKGHWVDYALNVLQASNILNIYTATQTTTEEGTTTVYNGIPASAVKVVDAGNGTVALELNGTPFADAEKLYKKNQDGGYDEYTEEEAATAISKISENLKEIGTAEGFKNGQSYYTIPLKHLRENEKATSSKYPVDAEGQYGLVRNHWYQIKVGKAVKLGKGIYEPKDDEKFTPNDNPNDDTYALGAQINILSWRIVGQSVDL